MADMQCSAFNSPEEQRAFAKRVMTPYLFPFLFAFSLANCKNVTTSLVHPPEKLSRAHKRRHGIPLSRYYTLNIEPMKKVLREEGQVESHGLEACAFGLPGALCELHRGKRIVWQISRPVLDSPTRARISKPGSRHERLCRKRATGDAVRLASFSSFLLFLCIPSNLERSPNVPSRALPG